MTTISRLSPSPRPIEPAPAPEPDPCCGDRPTDHAVRAPEETPVQRGLRTARAEPAALAHARFAGDPTLAKVARPGNGVELRPGSKGEAVKKVQEALIDLGFEIPTNGASGVFDRETLEAVQRFQAETLGRTYDRVGPKTMRMLDRLAPPPGARLERTLDYDKLYADGKLHVTIGMGYDEAKKDGSPGHHIEMVGDLFEGLSKDRGFVHYPPGAMSSKEQEALGLGGGRYDDKAHYFHKTLDDRGRPLDAVVRVIIPKMGGAAAKASHVRAMQEDEVVMYFGHSRYGLGPDYDSKHSSEGNFVIDKKGNRIGPRPSLAEVRALKDRPLDLAELSRAPEHQVLVFNACRSENYLDNLRDPRIFEGRTPDNTKIITTTTPTRILNYANHALRFVDGLATRESLDGMFRDHNQMEVDHRRRYGDPRSSLIDKAKATYRASGFLGPLESR